MSVVHVCMHMCVSCTCVYAYVCYMHMHMYVSCTCVYPYVCICTCAYAVEMFAPLMYVSTIINIFVRAWWSCSLACSFRPLPPEGDKKKEKIRREGEEG